MRLCPRRLCGLGACLVGHRVLPRARACARTARARRSCRASCRTRTSGTPAACRARRSELALDQLGVGVGPLAGHAVDAERLDRAADVDHAVVHRVAEARAGVAADDLAAALHHEAGHRAGIAEDQDRAALLVDARAGADAALDDDVAAAQRGAGQRAGVAVDHHDARHHVLAGRPADAAGDMDLRAVDHAAAEIAEGAFEGDPAAREDADAQRMARARVADGHLGDALLVERAGAARG